MAALQLPGAPAAVGQARAAGPRPTTKAPKRVTLRTRCAPPRALLDRGARRLVDDGLVYEEARAQRAVASHHAIARLLTRAATLPTTSVVPHPVLRGWHGRQRLHRQHREPAAGGCGQPRAGDVGRGNLGAAAAGCGAQGIRAVEAAHPHGRAGGVGRDSARAQLVRRGGQRGGAPRLGAVGCGAGARLGAATSTWLAFSLETRRMARLPPALRSWFLSDSPQPPRRVLARVAASVCDRELTCADVASRAASRWARTLRRSGAPRWRRARRAPRPASRACAAPTWT